MTAIIIPVGRDDHLAPGRFTWRDVIDSLDRIAETMDWLSDHGVCVLGFGLVRHGPVITVSANPSLYRLFRGCTDTIGQHQQGALRHVLWEGKRDNGVRVLWEEVAWAA